MKRYCIFSILFIITSAFADPLIFKTNYNYYEVFPKNQKDVMNAILRSSSVSPNNKYHRITGYYKADRIDYSLTVLEHKTGKCYADSIKTILIGTITLPKLHKNWTYDDAVYKEFNTEFLIIKEHELEHANIYIYFLDQFTQQVEELIKEKQKFDSCDSLYQHVSGLWKTAAIRIREKNTAFDCYEYGNKIDKGRCKNYEHIGFKGQQAPTFSSPDGGSKMTNNVNKLKERVLPFNPKGDQKCEGKVIEPMKNKFYCVTQISE